MSHFVALLYFHIKNGDTPRNERKQIKIVEYIYTTEHFQKYEVRVYQFKK